MKKIKAFWASLEGTAQISKRELFLGLLTCSLAGIVIGVFFGPKKNVVIGNHNGNGRMDDAAEEMPEGQDS